MIKIVCYCNIPYKYTYRALLNPSISQDEKLVQTNFDITNNLKNFEQYITIDEAIEDFDYIVERERKNISPYAYTYVGLFSNSHIVKEWRRK